MNIPLTFSLTNPDDADGGDWIDIEQVEYPDPRATLGQLAGFMDTLFDLDPCDPDKVSDVFNNEDNKTSVWGAPPEETFDFIVEKELTPEICDFGNNEYEATLNIYRSDLKEDTRLVLSVGKQGLMFIVNEEVEEHIKIEFATGHVLKYPVLQTVEDGFKYQWLNAVILRSGEDGTDVPVKLGRDGRTLSWGDKAMSGTLRVNYPTQYEQVKVLIPFNELGKPQKAKATIFYMGLVDEETIEPPEADEGDEETRERWCPDRDLTKYDHIITNVPFPKHSVKCFIEVTVDVLCQCSGELSYSYTRKDYTACPERTRCYDRQTSCEKNIGRRTEILYTRCDEATGDMNDPDFYKEKCCYTPDEAEVTLPSCKRVYSTLGRVEVKQSLIDSYRLQYKGYTINFISVVPEDGFCGKHIVEQKLVERACCDEPPPLVFTEAHDELSWSNQYEFCVDGIVPIRWSVSGRGLSVSTSTGKCAIIFTDICYCGGGTVTATDSCGRSITHAVEISGQCHTEELMYNNEESVDVLSNNSSGTVVIDGGHMPIVVSLDGDGFWLDAAHTMKSASFNSQGFQIYAGDACGACIITVTDNCGAEDLGSVLSTEGEWSNVPDVRCPDGAKGVVTADRYEVTGAGQGIIYAPYELNKEIRQAVSFNVAVRLTCCPSLDQTLWDCQDITQAEFCTSWEARGCAVWDVNLSSSGETIWWQDNCAWTYRSEYRQYCEETVYPPDGFQTRHKGKGYSEEATVWEWVC